MAIISSITFFGRVAAISGSALSLDLLFSPLELQSVQCMKLNRSRSVYVESNVQRNGNSYSSVEAMLNGGLAADISNIRDTMVQEVTQLNPNFKLSYKLSPERRREVWTDEPQELSLQEVEGQSSKSKFIYENLFYWMFEEGRNIIKALENNLREKLKLGQFGKAYTDVHMVKCGNVTKRTGEGRAQHQTYFHVDYTGDALRLDALRLPTVKLQRENILEELMYDKVNDPTKWNEVVLPNQKHQYELLGIRNIWMPFHNVDGHISTNNRKELKAMPYDFEKLINELETEPEERTQSSDSFSVKQAEDKGDPFIGIPRNPFLFNQLPYDVSSRLQVDKATDDDYMQFTTSADLSNDATDVNKNIKFHVFDPILFHRGSFTKKFFDTIGLASIELRCGIWKIK